MLKNILYVAASHHIFPDQRLPSAKIGITSSEADERIRSLNSTKMPIRVDLVGAWTFENCGVSAEDAEKAAHYLLAPYNVNGEWFQDPDDDLADRVGKFATRLGAAPVQASRDPELAELNAKQRRAREKMESVFEPMAKQLADNDVNWEYMLWKVGMDSPYGRLNISVRESGALYLRMHCGEFNADELSQRTPIEWNDGEGTIRLAANVRPSDLLNFVLKE